MKLFNRLLPLRFFYQFIIGLKYVSANVSENKEVSK